MIFETRRTTVVPLEEKHLEPLRRMRNDPSTNHWLTDIAPITKEQQLNWYEKLKNDESRMYLAIEAKREHVLVDNGLGVFEDFVGVLRSDQWDMNNRSVRIGIDISPKYRRKGFGREVFKEFINYLFDNYALHKLWFLVAEGNNIARTLYEKLCFKEEGRQREALFRDGRYWDYVSMSMLENEWRKK